MQLNVRHLQLQYVLIIVGVQFIGLDSALADYELDLYDLVEEVNGTFYEFFGLEQNADIADVKKSYRRLSLILHPDKNKDDDAERKFRQLVAVYDVLKSPEKRARYDDVLANGLPDWRQPVYYYRKVRKFGITESALALLIVMTVIHYAMVWAAYWEKKYEIEEVFNSRRKKDSKKKKHDDYNDELGNLKDQQLSSLERPTLVRLIPVQIGLGSVHLILSIPTWLKRIITSVKNYKQYPPVQQPADDNGPAQQQQKRRLVRDAFSDMPEPEMVPVCEPVVYTAANPMISEQETIEEKDCQQKQVIWTEADYSNLAKAMVRFPAGTSLRWEKIGQYLGHRPVDIVDRAKEMKAVYSGKPLLAADLLPEIKQSTNVLKTKGPTEPSKPTDTASIGVAVNDAAALVAKDPLRAGNVVKVTTAEAQSADLKLKASEWSQEQQKALEKALTEVSRSAEDRWEQIAEKVPGKAKLECMARYKFLSSMVRQKRKET